ncbi:LysR substrate-binding domain-containing protein [Burkholderia anthina]|uniref:LysR family transcriptional regulator n=1 Tax=Burkholderia anthina TaxID=179879 RepID=A0A6P2G579_9BURK|nr:LysR substrate-binding domain-containing protein [Burkholderia anthina]MBM2766511.1 hypothetical protein [Burkholderia anthina]VVU48882.1 LysR family transcriptional regulator [Burkholderia anthina]
MGDKQENGGVVELTEEVPYVAVAANHPLGRKPSPGIADLKHETWAIDSTSSVFGDCIAGLCRRAGYEPHINAKCRGFERGGAMPTSGAITRTRPHGRQKH